ncbi:hypothetical protein [Paraburkholderia sediminicola]|uniref:hypothetical protein n=1 Tax=Paraburkholderia sediminicola TaxID=458836 RepID=UPI0038B8140B
MKNGYSIEVFDFYEWLPGHGERRVGIRTEEGDLLVTIFYDETYGVHERELRFASVCSFYVQAFTGPSLLAAEDCATSSILRGALVEYLDSEVAVAWARHFGDVRVVRHYSVAFLAENLLLVVLAGGVSLGE